MGGSEEPALPAMGGQQPEAVPPPPAEAPAPSGEPARADADKGVVVIDMLAPSMVDRIYHEGGTVHFSYLMSPPLPTTREEALAVRDGALNNPLLKGTVVSADGQAVAIYLPITDKDISYKISQRLNEMIARLGGPEQYHITGLPVAEDTFGHDMFVQMAVSAPLAMLVIFILMLVFFRKLVLVISPMIVAMVRGDLHDGPADRARLHRAHHELDDPDLHHAHRGAGRHPHPLGVRSTATRPRATGRRRSCG